MSENEIPYTPVAGYRELNREELADMNAAKHMEAEVLMLILRLHRNTEYDSRWSAIARTHIEQGFMALNRAIARPDPVKLLTVPSTASSVEPPVKGRSTVEI